MRRFLCLFRVHSWERMKWGHSLSPYADLDCRECRACHRFEIVAYWSWHKADRANFDHIRPFPYTVTLPPDADWRPTHTVVTTSSETVTLA